LDFKEWVLEKKPWDWRSAKKLVESSFAQGCKTMNA
jgi:hypothetical protein